MRKTITFVHCYLQAMAQDEVPIRAAALAYYAVFSLFPLLLLIASAVGFFLSDAENQQQVLDALLKIFPTGQELLIDVIENALSGVVSARTLTGLIAIVGLLWAASGFFRGLEVSIYHIFAIGSRRPIWKSRGIGVLMVLVVLPLLLITVAISTMSRALVNLSFLPEYAKDFLDIGANYAVSLTIATLVFALMYRFIPSRWTPLRPTLIGAFISALAWLLVTYGFNWYLSSDFNSFNLVYGSIGTLFALILYMYLVNFIILLGAELTAQLARTKECEAPSLPAMVEQFIDNVRIRS